MSDAAAATKTIVFVNIAHAIDHFVLLIWPTAVIAVALERGLDYGTLLALATGTFIAFGLFALPVGWLSDRVGRRNMMIAFFLGCGVSCLGVAIADNAIGFAIWLFILGVFSAIYHPVGTAMLVSNARQLGRDLGWNGVWGNIGAAMASGVTAALAAAFGWRWAFIVPGFVCLALGLAYILMSPKEDAKGARKGEAAAIAVSRPLLLFIVFAFALIAGGTTFNFITIPLPKVLDERLGFGLPLAWVGSLATVVFMFGAATQLLMGRLIDRFTLPQVFVGLSVLQPIGLAIAATSTGATLLVGLVLAMAATYGQVVINDAMVARYVPPDYRARAFGLRYFLGFTTAGAAVPLIAYFHASGGFPMVLGFAAIFGAMIFSCAVAFLVFARPPAPAPQPAE